MTKYLLIAYLVFGEGDIPNSGLQLAIPFPTLESCVEAMTDSQIRTTVPLLTAESKCINAATKEEDADVPKAQPGRRI